MSTNQSRLHIPNDGSEQTLPATARSPPALRERRAPPRACVGNGPRNNLRSSGGGGAQDARIGALLAGATVLAGAGADDVARVRRRTSSATGLPAGLLRDVGRGAGRHSGRQARKSGRDAQPALVIGRQGLTTIL